MTPNPNHTAAQTLPGPIGVFDSGYGGLTVLAELRRWLPKHDFLYLGDNARAPYGTRSFSTVHQFTLQAVKYLWQQGCPLVILACNTASAKALRTIQQRYLPTSPDPSRRVLGVIRPTAEYVAQNSTNGHIGLLATPGTVASRSYEMEIQNLAPTFTVTPQPCPEWVPIVEQGLTNAPQTPAIIARDIRQILNRDPKIDTLILGCTHYPLLRHLIEQATPQGIQIITQGHIVAQSLANYLQRHPEMERRLSHNATVNYLTTGNAQTFNAHAAMFTGAPHINAKTITLC